MTEKLLKKFVWLGKRVLFKPIPPKEEGLIIIPDTAQETPQKGRVVSLGLEVKTGIKVKDKILFQQHYAKPCRINEEEFAHIELSRIYAVLDGDNVEDIKAMNDWVFLSWEYAAPIFAGTNLVRPESFDRMHYTGTVLSVGEKVTEIKPGHRVFFDRYCNPGKFQEGAKRYAFVHEFDVNCIIPEREVTIS